MRLTNKRIISRLFPILKKAIKNIPELDERDYYGHLSKRIQIEGYTVIYTNYEDYIVVAVTMLLTGKYDHATVSATIKNGRVIGYGYAKEFTGLGNGFYALLDENGKIIESEWD